MVTHEDICKSFGKQIEYMNMQLSSQNYKGFLESAKLFYDCMSAKINKLGEEDDVNGQT